MRTFYVSSAYVAAWFFSESMCAIAGAVFLFSERRDFRMHSGICKFRLNRMAKFAVHMRPFRSLEIEP